MTSGTPHRPDGAESSSGPAVVALGGGHGLAATLQAARSYAGSLTGVVSVGDDGGSSGRLRSDVGVEPPGDIRRCISALATSDGLLSNALEYRFDGGELAGHPIGNLLLAGLTKVAGDFQAAIDELCRLVGVDGTIFPATSIPIHLLADSDAGTITGEATIERATGIRNLRFEPDDPPVAPGAPKAIDAADQVIIGPGSLFTSVLAAAVVPDIQGALQRTLGQRVYVANVANERGRARGFGLNEHLMALADHEVPIDVVIVPSGSESVTPDKARVVVADIAAADRWSHDPARLGAVLHAVLRGD